MGGAVSSGRDNNELIDNLMSGNYIRSSKVERVFRALDRAEYMTPEARDQAYKDLAWRNGPLHLSSPCIYSEVMEGLELKPGLSFLNIGSGTGYLSTLAGLILGTSGISHGVEVHPAVVEYALKKIKLFFENSAILDDFDFCEPKFYQGNGLCLSQPLTGYDRVYCGAGCPGEYENYLKRLIKVGGILVMPLNDTLVQVRRVGEDKWTSRNLLNVSFATLRLPNAEDASDPVQLEPQTPVRLQLLARAVIRAAMWRGVTRRNPILREKPRPPPPAACPRRICLPLEPGGSVEGLNLLHALDSENGANEMNALLSLVISMGQSRVAGALRFDRVTPSDSEDDDRQDPPERPERPAGDRPDNRDQPDDPQDRDRDNDHPNRVLENPFIERLAPETDPGSRRVDINEPIILPRDEPSILRGVLSDSDDEDSLSDTSETTGNDDSRPWYAYNMGIPSSGKSRPTELMDSYTARKIRNATKKLKPGYRTGISDERSGNSNNTTIDTDASSADTATSSSVQVSPGNATDPGEPNATADDPGNNDSRPRANSTDENKLSNSRKSGRTRHLFGKSRDPLLMSLYENDTRPSTSCEKSKTSTDNPAETTLGEATDNIISQDPKSVPPRPDLPGMPSEVEIDLGKMSQTEATTSSEMVWEATRLDPVEGSEDETDTSKSKPKRQKLDSGIGENTPSGSSPDKSKSSESDHQPSDCPTDDAERSFHDMASDEDRFDTYDSHSNSESIIESDSPTDDTEDLIDERGRSPSYRSPMAGLLAHQANQRRLIARGGDARRVRLSYLMKQAVRELPLPHALKKFVNLGRCFEF